MLKKYRELFMINVFKHFPQIRHQLPLIAIFSISFQKRFYNKIYKALRESEAQLLNRVMMSILHD